MINRDGQGWPGRIAIAEHLGSDTFFYVESDVGRITVRTAGELGLRDRRPGPRIRRQIRDTASTVSHDGRQAANLRPAIEADVKIDSVCISRNTSWKGGWRWYRRRTGHRRGLRRCAWPKPAPRWSSPTSMPQVAEECATRSRPRVTRPEIVLMNVTDPQARHRGRECARCSTTASVDILVNNAGIARSETRGRGRSPTSTGSMSSTSISTASSGAAAPSAGICWSSGRARSSISARCPASSSTSRRSRATTTPPRRRVHHLTKSLAAEWARARGARQRGGADLHQHAAHRIRARRTRRCTRPGST